MEQSTIAALGVAAVLAPWLIEVIKRFIGNPTGNKALALSAVVSILVAGGVLAYRGQLAWHEPGALFASAGLVLGVASTVYQFFQKAVQAPVDTLKSYLVK